MPPRTLNLKKAVLPVSNREDEYENSAGSDQDCVKNEYGQPGPSLPLRGACSRRISSPPSATASGRAGADIPAKAPKPGAGLESEERAPIQRLNFRFGTADGDANAITVMEAFQGEGESLFRWGETGAALKRVASLCNSTEAFQGPKGEPLLSVGTLQ